MLIQVARVIVGLIGLAGDIWSIVRWADRSGLTAMIELGPPEYAAILTICTGLFAWSVSRSARNAFTWGARKYTDQGKFKALVVDISDLEDRFRMVAGVKLVRQSDKRAWDVLSEKLSDLRLFSPEELTNYSATVWLSHIKSYSERGSLEDARKFASREAL